MVYFSTTAIPRSVANARSVAITGSGSTTGTTSSTTGSVTCALTVTWASGSARA